MPIRSITNRGTPSDTLTMILAGGEGTRLLPLTRDRAKPAVPFGGRYRIVDIVLSNFINSGFFKIKVLTQYKSHSLEQHVARAWRMAPVTDDFVECLPAQQRLGLNWYRGNADAIYQSVHVIQDEMPRDVLIFGADHVYQMDVSQMLEYHVQVGALATVAVIPVPIQEASRFGVVAVDDRMRIVEFQEKPANPQHIPGDPGMALASMGNYIFRTDCLLQGLAEDAGREDSAHDFGKNILPRLVGRELFAYDFSRNRVPGSTEHNYGYWRDIGDIDSYLDANMDLISYHPRFNLYNPSWPLRSGMRHLPPAKFVHMDETSKRVGIAIQSMVSGGCVVSGGLVQTSILGPNVRINSFAEVKDCILLEQVSVGRGSKLNKVIVDKDVVIPGGVQIGFDHDQDRARGLTVSEGGVVVVPKKAVIDG